MLTKAVNLFDSYRQTILDHPIISIDELNEKSFKWESNNNVRYKRRAII